MSNIPISSLPLAISLTGSETVPGVQAGTTKRFSISLINSSNPANLPAGGVTGQGLIKQSDTSYDTKWATVAGFGTVQQVDTGTGLTGGPITLTGTIALASVATGRVLANVSGISAAPIPNTPSSVLDVIGSTRGQLLYRGASGWSVLGPGSIGQILTTGGAGADPAWSAVGSGTVQSVALALPSSILTVSGSPITTTGTLTGTLATQNANKVWAGPTTGADAQPTFRALVGADLPNPAASTLGGIQSYAAVSSQWIRSISTSGVPASSQPAFSDISGNIALSQFGTQTANTFLSGPSSAGPSNPTFRAIVGADLPNPSSTTLGGVQSLASVASRWINTISTSGVPSATQPAFTDISGSVTLAQFPTISNNTILANTSGGSAVPAATGMSTLLDILGSTQGQILYRNASAWVPLAVGADGQVLTTHGAAANPTWTTVTGTGTVTDIAAGTGISTGGANITTTGTISLAAIASNRILANITGGSAAPIANTMTSLLDIIGSTQGQVLYRGASNWAALAAGTSGQYLQTLGAGSTPQWASPVTSVATAGLATGGPITSTGTVTVTAATKSDEQTGTSTTTVVTPAQQQQHDSAAKAWVNIVGSSGVINGSYNIASVSRTGTGNYNVTFTTNFANQFYACAATSQTSGTNTVPVTSAKTSSGFTITTLGVTSGLPTDPLTIDVVCYGRQ